jgi:hypothetical protein
MKVALRTIIIAALSISSAVLIASCGHNDDPWVDPKGACVNGLSGICWNNSTAWGCFLGYWYEGKSCADLGLSVVPSTHTGPEQDVIAQCIRDYCTRLWPGGPKDQECIKECGGPIAGDYPGLTTTAVPFGGVYDMTQEVSLEVNIDISPYAECLLWTDPDDVIETYYTTDNSIPTPISQLYTAPLLIDHDTILQFFSILGDCTEEVLHIESYTINE